MCVLELTYSAMRARLQAYIKDNFGVIIVTLFIFVAGLASGIRIVQSMYHDQAAEIMQILPDVLRANGVPWLQCFMLSLFSHALIACMLLLSGHWLPTVPLWIAGILMRGMLVGAAIGACVSAWPLHTVIVAILLLQLETAVMLPPFLRLAVLSQKQFTASCKQKFGVTQQTLLPNDYTILFLKAALGLIPAMAFQSFITPAILALFC